MTHETDVVVIGAGAAGLAAGRMLAAAGASFVILEAMHRRGGRAFTDTASLGLPWDHGCHWLHSASENPFTAVARRLGRGFLDRASWHRRSFHGVTRAETAAEAATREAAVETAFTRRAQAAAALRAGTRPDGTTAAAMGPLPDPASRLITHWTGLEAACDPDRLSLADLAHYRDTDENWPVEDGYGALIAAEAADLHVTLNCPVTGIDRTGLRLAVETPRGTIAARAVILTVSVAVLKGAAIRFTPDLPAPHRTALEALDLGAAEKVAFRFDGHALPCEASVYLDLCDLGDTRRPPMTAFVHPFGRPMAVCGIAGPAAAALVAEGEAALEAHARALLRDAFGADILKRITASATTRWLNDPRIGGAYASATVGQFGARAALAAAIEDRLFIAGEATHPHFFTTAHGARMEGERAAGAALARLGASTAEAPAA